MAAEGTEGPLTLPFLLAMHRFVQLQFQHIREKKQTQERAPYPMRLCPALERQERSQWLADRIILEKRVGMEHSDAQNLPVPFLELISLKNLFAFIVCV